MGADHLCVYPRTSARIVASPCPHQMVGWSTRSTFGVSRAFEGPSWGPKHRRKADTEWRGAPDGHHQRATHGAGLGRAGRPATPRRRPAAHRRPVDMSRLFFLRKIMMSEPPQRGGSAPSLPPMSCGRESERSHRKEEPQTSHFPSYSDLVSKAKLCNEFSGLPREKLPRTPCSHHLWTSWGKNCGALWRNIFSWRVSRQPGGWDPSHMS